ncbi:MAG: hypothetical protein Q7Q71_04105 [Verrucomicrobiota bacterium JB023]|nr:hypothetical protein [Verrucomicrobiota bacterium JB023]
MKNNVLPALAATAITLGSSAQVRADVPELLNVQGRIDVDGLNYDGDGTFKFAIVSLSGATTHWSHDGTSVAGSEPTSGVTIPVTNGHYSVHLGDTDLTNMDALPASVFEEENIALRIWFDDGVNGSQQLSPDRRFVSTAFALNAANVQDGAIGPSKIAANSITSGQLAAGSVTSSEISGNSIDTTKIVNGTLLGEDFAEGSIMGSALANPLEVGAADENGTVNVWDSSYGLQSVKLDGGNHRIETYGADGLLQTRLWGPSYGEVQLYDASEDNFNTVRLSSQESLLALQIPGGALRLSNEDNLHLYAKASSANGGILSLYQLDGQNGVNLQGDANGGGFGTFYQADEQPGIELDANGNDITFYQDDDDIGLRLTAASSGAISVRDSDGTTAVSISGSGNSTTYYADDGSIGVLIDGESSGAGYLSVRNNTGSTRVAIDGEGLNDGGSIVVDDETGTQTVRLLGAQASGKGGSLTLYEDDGSATVALRQDTGSERGGEIILYDGDGNSRIDMEASESGEDGAQIVLRDATGAATLTLDGEFGAGGASRVTTGTVQITGGSDLSEQFEISDGMSEIAPEPGMLVCIDPENPGALKPSSRAHDRTVAGIISGAGGINPGMLMGQVDSIADGEHPVALTGRVYCMVDDSNGEILPGDLITTSDTPGHGMKVVDHEQARGAIIGKAMTRLEGDSGLVLVLVSLQ